MRYVKIKAKNYNEAMMKLKMEYGDEAIPISHKYIKEGGLFQSRLFAKDVVELTAAIQEKKRMTVPRSERKSTLDVTVDEDFTSKVVGSRIINNVEDESIQERLASMKSLNQTAKNDVKKESSPGRTDTAVTGTVQIRQEELESLRRIEKEFHEIKEKLNRMMEDRGRENRREELDEHEDPNIKSCFDVLMRNDFDREDCLSLISRVKNAMSREDLKDRFKIEKTIKDLLKSRVVTSGPIRPEGKKKVIMFFGPTGVGKTTTMAKLGALYALREGYRVSFVSIDNYRIAATEQLKKYAEIIKIPIFIVNDTESFKEVIDREKSDIIMIDTSGRSHRNSIKISEIKHYAELVSYDFEKVLCVSANTKKGDVVDVFNAFNVINFDSIIITKVDETSSIGNIIDIADKYSKPISYYTNGQEVPNDIYVAEPEKLLNILFGGAP